MSAIPEPIDDPEALARQLAGSLRSANDGLASFLEALRRSGLPRAADGYRRLSGVLVQQRLWALRHRRDELDGPFSQLVRTSAEIHALLAAYEALFRPLVAIDRLTIVAGPDLGTPDEPDGALVRSLEARGPMGPSRLARIAGLDRDEAVRRLDRLVSAGRLVRRGWGRGRSYALASTAP